MMPMTLPLSQWPPKIAYSFNLTVTRSIQNVRRGQFIRTSGYRNSVPKRSTSPVLILTIPSLRGHFVGALLCMKRAARARHRPARPYGPFDHKSCAREPISKIKIHNNSRKISIIYHRHRLWQSGGFNPTQPRPTQTFSLSANLRRWLM